MKKILISGLFIFLSLPVFASNTLQQQAEKEFFNNPDTFLRYKASASIFHIWEDYQISKANPSADTYYNELLENKKKYCRFSGEKNKINCEYTNKLIDGMNILGNNNVLFNNNYEECVNLYKSKRIIIEDKDFPQLDEKIRLLIISLF